MITLFSTCKPFRGLYANIQWNALASWARSVPRPDVILFGDDTGTAQAAREFGFQHIPDIRTQNLEEADMGRPHEIRQVRKPFLPDMIEIAQQIATTDYLAFVNADILLANLTATIARICSQLPPKFLLIGRRRNVKITQRFDFPLGWSKRLLGQSYLHPPCGKDYLVFPKHLWSNLPELAVGYIGFDDYLVNHTLALNIPVIDATKQVLVFHQEHPIRQRGDAGDTKNFQALGYESPEAIGGFTTDATWVLDADGKLRKK